MSTQQRFTGFLFAVLVITTTAVATAQQRRAPSGGNAALIAADFAEVVEITSSDHEGFRIGVGRVHAWRFDGNWESMTSDLVQEQGQNATLRAVGRAGSIAAPYIPGGSVVSAALAGGGQARSALLVAEWSVEDGRFRVRVLHADGLDEALVSFLDRQFTRAFNRIATADGPRYYRVPLMIWGEPHIRESDNPVED